MIERYNEETGRVDVIEDGAPRFMVPVMFNGAFNGEMVEATIWTRAWNPCFDKIARPVEPYPKTVGWMYSGESIVVDHVSYKLFNRCETQEVYDALSF